MQRRNSQPVYSWAIFLLLLDFSWAQSNQYFEWKPVKTTSHAAVLPYKRDETTSSSSSSYGGRYYDDISAPYRGTTRFYPDTSVPYVNGPYSDDSSYSVDFPNSQQYQYPVDSGSYENYKYGKDDNFNITVEKYGGFGGTGDTRGFGAYDYPKKTVQEDVPQHLQIDPKVGITDFPDLLRLGKARMYRRRHPLPVHPLPPPL